MKRIAPLLLLPLFFFSCSSPSLSLPRANAMLSPDDIAAFDSVFLDVAAVQSSELHSLLVIRDGVVVYERYAPGHSSSSLHTCWSATKSFTAIAVALAVQDGLFCVDTPIVRYLPSESLPDTLSPELLSLTPRHLLSMASGLRADSITLRIRHGERFDPVRETLERGFRRSPGEVWAYNNADTYLLAVALANVLGRPLDDYLSERIFRPLGINDYSYLTDSRGYCCGAFGLSLSAESLAKAGLLLLRRGRWFDRQLIDASLVDSLTTVRIYQPGAPDSSDWRCGYCSQMWAGLEPGSYRFDGMWGQYVIVLPEQNAVCVMTSLCTDREAQLASVRSRVFSRL